MSNQKRSPRQGAGSRDIPSRKLDRMVRHRNRVGRDYIHLLEYDPAVLTYQEYPCIIRYRQESFEYSYTPDFSVRWHKCSSGIVISTMQAYVDDPKYLPKWTATQLWCEQLGYEFGMVTEYSLQGHQVLLSNLNMLTVHAHQALPSQVYEYLMKIVMEESDSLSIAEIVQKVPQFEARVTRSYIWHLLATGTLSTDLTIPLHVDETRVASKGVLDQYGISRRFSLNSLECQSDAKQNFIEST